MTTNYEFQKAVRDLFNGWEWIDPFALTLTLKQARLENGFRFFNDDIEAGQNLKWCLNRVNRAVFGNAAVRYRKRLQVASVLEGTDLKRSHFHLVVDAPDRMPKRELIDLFLSTWKASPWGYRNNHFFREAERSFINYMTKLKDKVVFLDSIDWINCHRVTSSYNINKYNDLDC